jgi:hypothetical protein
MKEIFRIVEVILKAWKNQRNERKTKIRRKMSFEIYGDVKKQEELEPSVA